MTSWKAFMLLLGTVVAEHPPADQLWQVKPAVNTTDVLFAGWKQIPTVKEIEVSNGVSIGRTYAHHPELFYMDSKTYLIFSSAPVDEDSMGQDVRISVSSDDGLTWSANQVVMPAALLPNQTDVKNFTYWCSRNITQRAWQALTFVYLTESDKLYAIGQGASVVCPGDKQSAGRIAVQINKANGTAADDPCWIEKNEYTEPQLFSHTIYGTQYGMKDCTDADEINAIIREPDQAPAWSPWLYNHKLYAADGIHNMQEQTHAVRFTDHHGSATGGYWQRFWRDISPTNNTHAVWVEYNDDEGGQGWYPYTLSEYGNKIYQTSIPDAKTKQYLGRITPSGDRYLIHNPVYRDDLSRQPLTIAMSRGYRATGMQQTYRSIGVLRTNASTIIAPETRDRYKNHGFSYPTAVQVGGSLIVAYSENKENIWVSVVRIQDLPDE
ncbi:hypothetical protein AC578_798 [Pseudocercospora eumusae]|uniref:BT-1020-like N-terminal beta-propeller domain-containing protein n=1 Tax=Pseudocercospora eumusae TaxID=321146 RepID=A0A139HC17_9PEZI|nr:hypothetical protein AC578_798 [Pseudocercospora eumusae]